MNANDEIGTEITESPSRSSLHLIPGLISNWNFSASTVPRWRRRQFIETLLKKGRPRPSWTEIRPLTCRPKWAVYFMYCPDGIFTSAHKFSLSGLKDSGENILVICASRNASEIPLEVYQFASALFWKALDGYDFSAYTLALREISRKSPHADVLLLNDSVFGPFTKIHWATTDAPWDLAGFTASSQIENHIQSYAFILRDVTPSRMKKLATIFFPCLSISTAVDVVHIQETRLARVASPHMSVGAFWYGKAEDVVDPMLVRPFELIRANFPFLKRSLLGKHKKYQNSEELLSLLHDLRHPVDHQITDALFVNANGERWR